MVRLWPDVFSNAVDPGWVPTRIGGTDAPQDLGKGCATQVALSTSDDSRFSRLTGQYLHHMATREPSKIVRDVVFQDRLLDLCRDLTDIALQVPDGELWSREAARSVEGQTRPFKRGRVNVRSFQRCRSKAKVSPVPFPDLPGSQVRTVSILLEVWLARREGFAQQETILEARGTARRQDLVPWN